MAIKKGREQYKQLKLGALGGELAIKTMCKPIEEVEGMTEEELKRWKHRKTSKKPVKGRGGKMKGGKTAAKPVDRATLQIILGLCIPVKELAKTRSQI
jgi:hypothetical protein